MTKNAPSPAPETSPWHALSIEEVAQRLESDVEAGLATAEVRRRRDLFGDNQLEEAADRPVWRLVLEQFRDVLILVLVAAAVVSGLVGEASDTIAILTIVVLNAAFGAVQEYRADRALALLRDMAAPEVEVVRDGERQEIPLVEVVPGDVVLLEAGKLVPADLRLVDVQGLEVEEAVLTGESVPVAKRTEPVDDPEAPLGDRHDMAYRGTVVTRGRARAVAVATGMGTELGRIAHLLARAGTVATPLQRRLARFGRRLAVVVLAVCALVFVSGLLRGEPLTLMFLVAVSLAVAAIPEALPAVVSISLALGSRRMVEHNALVRRLPAAESLGSVTTICADKTGTLTQNRMRAEAVWLEATWLGSGSARLERRAEADAEQPVPALLRALALSNDASVDEAGEVHGDPTEVALQRLALELGFDRRRLEVRLPRVAELSFDAERKRMSTVHRREGGFLLLTKGAPEAVVPRCSGRLGERGIVELDEEAVLAAAGEKAADGFRILAVAQRPLERRPETLDPDPVETDLVLLGLVALIDPPRPEAEEAVRLCRSAGIRPAMITGDHPATALAIARRLGIAEDDEEVVDGPTLASWDDRRLAERVPTVSVYARVSPEQKVRIVRALQERGELVAMTGDGVNDAPALKRAEIGVAMGEKGTDVAREAAGMVLLDDNFATIVAAVREGRRIFDNIRKFIRYTMTSNSGEIWTLTLAPFLGLPLPLLPIQILWINLVTDGLPGLALAVEKTEPDVMARPPRSPDESVFARGLGWHALVIGLLIAGLCLGAQAWAWHGGSQAWQTMVFTVLVLCQLAHSLVVRSERQSLLRQGLLSNLPLLGAVGLTVGLQLVIVYWPPLQPFFETEALSATELGICFALPLVVVLVVEVEKSLVRRGLLHRERRQAV